MTKLASGCLAIALSVHVSAQTPAPAPASPAPAPNAAQAPAITPTPVTTPPTGNGPAPPAISPQQHLSDAAAVLSSVSDSSVSRSTTRRNLLQLRKDFGALTGAYKDPTTLVAVWQSPVYEVERDLVLLIGGGGPLQPDDAKPVPGLAEEVTDSAARDALKTFRRHVELFYDAASATPVSVIKPGEAPVN